MLYGLFCVRSPARDLQQPNVRLYARGQPLYLQAFLVELRELLVAPLYQRLALGVGLPHDPGGSLNRHAGDGLHEHPDHLGHRVLPVVA